MSFYVLINVLFISINYSAKAGLLLVASILLVSVNYFSFCCCFLFVFSSLIFNFLIWIWSCRRWSSLIFLEKSLKLFIYSIYFCI